MGRWYEPIRGNWRPNAPWVVLEDDGAHRLLQVHDDGERTLRAERVLVTGQEAWRDYTLKVRLQVLTGRGQAGVAFRYETSRHHYRLVLEGGRALQLLRVAHDARDLLAEMPFDYDGEAAHELEVHLAGDRIAAGIDGRAEFEVHDGRYPRGRIALVATCQVMYDRVEVTAGARITLVEG